VKRTGQVPFMKLQVGIMVLIAFGLLLWATFQSGSFRLGREEDLTLRFTTVGGLETGSVVRLNGVPVGMVRDIALRPNDNDVHVTLGVKKGTRARLHQGASARITTVGFLSELYVALDTGDETKPAITSDDQIETGAVADPQAMMAQVKGMADSLDVLLGNLNRAGRRFARGQGTLGKLSEDDALYDQMVTLSRNANTLTKQMSESQKELTDRLVALSSSLDSLSWRMQHGDNSVARLLQSDDLYNHLASTTARVDSVLAVLQSGKGTFGQMLSDSTLYDDTRALMGSMKRLMSEIEKNPKKYLKVSIF
jgi:phospholipid/cholesterol/gamma-HCH transport system substrate-binding protein